jgi:hypothetical protein
MGGKPAPPGIDARRAQFGINGEWRDSGKDREAVAFSAVGRRLREELADSMNLQQGVQSAATASQLGAYFQYVLDQPAVDLDHGITADEEGEELAGGQVVGVEDAGPLHVRPAAGAGANGVHG